MSLTISKSPSFFCTHVNKTIPSDDERFNRFMLDITDDSDVEQLKEMIVLIPGFKWTFGAASWNDRSILHFAAEQNNSAVISYAVGEGGSDLLELAEDFNNATPLWRAAECNSYNAVKKLIALGSKVNVIGKNRIYGYVSSLEQALLINTKLDGQTDPRAGYPIAKLLLKNGARIQEPTCIPEKVALFLKEFSSEIASVSEKLKKGDPIDEIEFDAFDFINAEDIAKKREQVLGTVLEPSLIRDLIQMVQKFDEGESYKDAHGLRLNSLFREEALH